MSIVLSSSLSDAPKKHHLEGNKTSEVVRRSVNYVPEIWGDRFVASSPDSLKPDAQTQQRANELKEEVRKMLRNVDDHLQELNLIDAVQRLGVAYHFEEEIAQALLRIYKSGRDYRDDLHAVALQFRLLRQEGYHVSPDVFMKFKDEEGKFKRTLAGDTRSLLSLYEAAHMGTHGENILDEAIAFTREHFNSALPCLKPPFSTLVELALELPLRKRIERFQTSYYISIYQENKDRSDILLKFAKLDFNLLQLLHQEELREVSMWWKSWDFAAKLPFIRDRVVECYFWILGVYFEPQYSRARKMLTKIISLTSIMDDIYDVHGTLEELEPYTDAIQRWDQSVIDQFPDYIKLHFSALLDTVDKFEEELAQEGKSYRIPYLKQVMHDEVIKIRAEGLKEQVRRMLQNASDPLVEMNLIDSIQRLGVAYHFETEIEEKLKRWYNAWFDGLNDGEDLHAVALQFRLLRQHGYNVSPDVFCKFKDNTGNFKANLARDIRSLLSLYEASFLGTYEEDILDEANKFARDHLQLAVHHLSSPLSTLVKLALELPLQKRVQRLQARCYISIYEEERNDALLEFAKLDFNMLQSLHKRELGNISL